MARYCAFLRAVNVGGRVVKMAVLRDALTEAGFTDVETHIQSGNVLVGSTARSTAAVERALERALADCCGFDVPTMVRTPKQLAAVIGDAPTSPLRGDARHYCMFLRDAPTPAKTKDVEAWDVDGERMRVVGRELHLWLTKPTHEAKVNNAKIEKLLGVAGTTRDWKVVNALAEKWGAR